MTDESNLLRQLIADKLEEALLGRPTNQAINTWRIAEKVAEAVLDELTRLDVQVVNMYGRPLREDG